MIRVDLHSHTLHSHARDSAQDMAAAAFANGLAVFGFSEHSLRPDGYRYPTDYQPNLEAGFAEYIREVQEEKQRYAGRMTVLLGLELDYMPAEEAFARDAAAAYPYDYIIGGLHFQGTWGFDYQAEDWNSLSDEACFEHFAQYYRDLATMARSGLFQIAAHPDLIKIFRVPTFHSWIARPDALELARAALHAMKTHGVAMEVSSAGLRKNLGEPYPCRPLMALAQELELPISFGSDAHKASDVTYGFTELAAYAAEFGYTQSVSFANRAREFHSFR